MCPETSTLSAYFDDELAGEARETVARHIASCPGCARVVEEYRTLSLKLSTASSVDTSIATARSKTHIRNRAVLERSRGPFGRTLNVPAPIAALAALLIVVLSIGLVWSNQQDGGSGVPIADSQSNVFDEILSFLESGQPAEPVTFTLPAHAELRPVSEPTFMREAEYHRVLQ